MQTDAEGRSGRAGLADLAREAPAFFVRARISDQGFVPQGARNHLRINAIKAFGSLEALERVLSE